MSGDVFGNGVLLSEHIRLVAAFDHRHIFVDPEPDAASTYAERHRLFNLPRSSWDDFSKSLISAGGGVWPRTAKSIAISAQMSAALGIEEPAKSMSPSELIKAILRAPVDLLWNGGIGTYVKASYESHLDVGDKTNDGVRVNGAQLRARVVGEGGNLGLTQRGRVEYAQKGGRVVDGVRHAHICTDFIDNSAGVDCSDHEVNIKILLGGVVADGELTVDERDELLAEMTDEVAELVLRDNYDQATRAGDRPGAVALTASGAPAHDLGDGAGGAARSRARGDADRRGPGRPGGRGIRADVSGVRGAAGVHEDHPRAGDQRVAAAGRGVDAGGAASTTSRRRCGTAMRIGCRATGCGGRS